MQHKRLYVSAVCFAAAVVGLPACSSTYRQCLGWKTSGQMFATLNSCQQCAEAMEGSSFDAINGCALGLDAASLFEATQPKPRVQTPPRQGS